MKVSLFEWDVPICTASRRLKLFKIMVNPKKRSHQAGLEPTPPTLQSCERLGHGLNCKEKRESSYQWKEGCGRRQPSRETALHNWEQRKSRNVPRGRRKSDGSQRKVLCRWRPSGSSLSHRVEEGCSVLDLNKDIFIPQTRLEDVIKAGLFSRVREKYSVALALYPDFTTPILHSQPAPSWAAQRLRDRSFLLTCLELHLMSL